MAKPDDTALRRIPTGVRGLDRVLAGGLLETGVCIVQGWPGAGKTILANQICFHQAASGRRALYYTLLTEAHERMLAFLSPMSFFRASVIPEGVSYLSGFKVLEVEGLLGVARNIRDAVTNQRPALLVIDGLAAVEAASANDTALKKFVHELQTISALFHTAIVLLTSPAEPQRLGALHLLVDVIIELTAPVSRIASQRTLEVTKLRGAGQIRGTHTVTISSDGVTVLPRVEAVLADIIPQERKVSEQRRGFGIANLDRMLSGGLPAGSSTLIAGASGGGKTLLGLHFVAAGLATNEKAVWLTFHERRDELRAKAERFGLQEVSAALDSGAIEVVWQSQVETNIDRIAWSLVSAFEKLRPARIVIDDLHGLESEGPPERTQDVFTALSEYLTGHGANLIASVEALELIGGAPARACQNILLMQSADIPGHMRRVLSILKMRDSDYDPSIHAVAIGKRGFEIGAPLASDAVIRGHVGRPGNGRDAGAPR